MSQLPGFNQRQPPRPIAAAPRGDSDLIKLVQGRLAGDTVWRTFAQNGAWVCPYCLSAIHRRSGRSVEESIAHHLGSCRNFAGGRGQVQPSARILGRVSFENLTHLAANDPAWRVYDHEGHWFCPSCLERIPQCRLQGGQITSFVHHAMGSHLSACASYQAGRMHAADQVIRARDRHVQVPALAKVVAAQLQNSAWRYANALGCWICPCCLNGVAEVRLMQPQDWQRAPESMARHLLNNCSAYHPDRLVVQREVAVRQAAAENQVAPVPVAKSRGGTDRVGVVRTPVQGNQVAGTHPTPTLRTGQRTTDPTGMAVIQAPAGTVTANRIAPPAASRRTTDPMRTPRPLVTPQVVSSEPPDEPDPPLSAKSVNLDQTVLGRLAAEDDAPFTAQPPAVERQPTSRRSSTASIIQPEPPAAVPDQPQESDEQPDLRRATPVDRGTETGTEAGAGTGRTDRDHLTWMDTAEDRATIAAAEAADAPADTAGESAADEMARAVELQQDLLTVAPEVPGFAFATRFIPCAGISGDFYEFIQLPDGKIGFALGDVSGHGVQAGLIMSMAKKTLEIYALQGGGPADVLCRVNDALLRDLAGRLFISLTYAILDPDARRITWVRAGHAPTIRFNHRTGDLVEIRPRGMVVGMKGGAAFRNAIEEEITTVEAGDTFLLYTDGITETMNPQLEEYGVERLRDIVRQCASDGPEVLVTQILDRVRHFRGARSEADDMTLLAFSAA